MVEDEPLACILLATRNGERFIEAQIQSIVLQNYSNWLLLASDDSSTDRTRAILTEAASADSRITLLDSSDDRPGSATNNFARLLLAGLDTPASAFFFCDQDDHWRPDKLEKQLRSLAANPSPKLTYSDIERVDRNLVPLKNEAVFSVADQNVDLSYLLSLNSIPGCCMAFNRPLAQIAAPIPESAVMHDWWLALVAAACNGLEFLDEPLVCYRQHPFNTIGAPTMGQFIAHPKQWGTLLRTGSRELQRTFAQADNLAKRLQPVKPLPLDSIQALQRYSSLPSLTPGQRFAAARRLGLRRGKWIQRVLLYYRLLLLAR